MPWKHPTFIKKFLPYLIDSACSYKVFSFFIVFLYCHLLDLISWIG